MENKQTLEHTLHSFMLVIHSKERNSFVPEIEGDRAFGIVEISDKERDYRLGTDRNVAEFINQYAMKAVRATAYFGISEDALHGIAKKIAKAKDYADAVQIANQAFLKEYTEFR